MTPDITETCFQNSNIILFIYLNAHCLISMGTKKTIFLCILHLFFHFFLLISHCLVSLITKPDITKTFFQNPNIFSYSLF